MKIAIVGGGFCGVATAWHLLSREPPLPNVTVTIFDSNEIGGGASGIAAGLLHPFAGAHAKLNRMGREGFTATMKLVSIASAYLQKPVSLHPPGILRLALTEAQNNDYFTAASKYPFDVLWYAEDEVQKLCPFCTRAPGIWIKEGIALDAALYLRGLWSGCRQKGAGFIKQKIERLEDLKEYDQIIFTTGAQTKQFSLFADLPITLIKGQILELECPETLPKLHFPVNSQAYVLPCLGGDTYMAGTTYEKHFDSPLPDREKAIQEIMPKAVEMIPMLASAKVINCQAGLRAVTPDHLPKIYRIKENVWLLTGMGSKGLLYHGLFAEKLVEEMANSWQSSR